MKSKIFYKENIVTFLICLFLNTHLIISQTNEHNLERYWHLRYRLTNYFMVVGDGPGESLPADIRNLYNGNTLAWKETPAQLGNYIGVLATEYHLLKNNNQPTDRTLTELYYALKAVKRLDLAGDGIENGYLISDDINPNDLDPNSFLNTANHKDLLNNNIIRPESESYVPYSGEVCKIKHIESDRSASSQDMLFNLLMGLALVKKYVDNGNAGSNFYNYITQSNFYYYRFELDAKTQADLIVSYMEESPFDNSIHWHLTKPGGSEISNGNGGNAIAFSYGIAKAGEFITGIDYTAHSWPALWQPFQNISANRWNFSNNTLSSILAAIGDSWTNSDDINTTKAGILFNGDYDAGLLGLVWPENHHGNELFYGAVHRLLHGYYLGVAPAFDMCKMKTILDNAPWDGPYCHSATDKASGGWAASRRFYNAPPDQYDGQNPPGPDFQGNYSGLDYMLFHNLYYCLQEGEYNITETMPGYFFAPMYYITDPYQFNGKYKKIIIQNTTIHQDPTYLLYGAAIIIGGPQGVELNSVTVREGAELTISTDNDCAVDPDDFIFDSFNYKNLIINNESINDSLPSYKMIPESELQKSANLIISPNPNDGTFRVSVTKNSQPIGVKEIKVYDLMGKVVWENKTPTGHLFNIDISSCAHGIYYVRAINELDEIEIKKLTKQ